VKKKRGRNKKRLGDYRERKKNLLKLWLF